MSAAKSSSAGWTVIGLQLRAPAPWSGAVSRVSEPIRQSHRVPSYARSLRVGVYRTSFEGARRSVIIIGRGHLHLIRGGLLTRKLADFQRLAVELAVVQ